MRGTLRHSSATGIALVAAATFAAASAAHPTLLFTDADVAALRAKVADGGDDDRAWAAILERWPAYEAAPPESLVGMLRGVEAVSELGLLTHVAQFGPEPRQALRSIVLAIANSPGVEPDDFRGSLRLRALALGYDLGFDAFDASERSYLRAEIRAALDYMPGEFNYYRYAFNPFTSNRGATVGAAIGLAVIAIWPESTPAERVALVQALAFGDRLVRECLTDNLAPDGAYREGVLYAAWTMRMVLPYVEARRRFDGVDLAADPRLARMAEWLAYEVLPQGGGCTNNVNDSPLFSRPLAVHSTYLAWAQMRFASGLALWLYRHVAGDLGWDTGTGGDCVATVLWSRPGVTPDPGSLLPSSRHFADRGQYVYRSAWKSGTSGDETLFSLYAGRFTGGHAQEDQGQFTLYAGGERFVVDNGAVHPTLRPKDSIAHNIVLVDGRGQHNAGQSIGTDARIPASLLAPFCDWVRADLESAYRTHSPLNDPDVPWPGLDWSWGYDGGTPLRRAFRTALVVKGDDAPAWMLIADDVQMDAALHRYEWQLHTDSSNTIAASGDAAVIRGARARLCLWFAHTSASPLWFDARPFANGGQDPSTLRLVAATDAVAPHFVVALVPLPVAAAAPTVTTRAAAGTTEVHLAWGASGVTDLVVINTDAGREPEPDRRDWSKPRAPAHASIGSLHTDGRLAVARSRGSEVVAWALAEGRRLVHAGLRLANSIATAARRCRERPWSSIVTTSVSSPGRRT
jgi:hypothetical protein